MKKLFAILMSIMMIACFMPTMAFADAATGTIATADKITVSGSIDGGQDYKRCSNIPRKRI